MKHLPWDNPRVFLEAWTATDYEGYAPPYLNVTQVGSMVEITMRAPVKTDGSMGDTFTFQVNVWTANKIADTIKTAINKFECGLSERLFDEHFESKQTTICPHCTGLEMPDSYPCPTCKGTQRVPRMEEATLEVEQNAAIDAALKEATK